MIVAKVEFISKQKTENVKIVLFSTEKQQTKDFNGFAPVF